MKYENTLKALQMEGRKIINEEMTDKEKQDIMNSNQPIQIIFGVALGNYEIKNLDNPKDIVPISLPGKKGVKYMVCYKGDWDFKIVELDDDENIVRAFVW